MSKRNILELHKDLNTYAKGALEQAEQIASSAKAQLKEVRRLEGELLERIARREEAQREQDAALQEQAPVSDAPSQPVKEAQQEPPKPKAQEPAEEPQPAAQEQKVEQTQIEEKPIKVEMEKKEKKEGNTAVKPQAGARAGSQPSREETGKQAQDKELRKEKKVALPGQLNLTMPKIRVVRSAKEEELEQQKREERRKELARQSAEQSRQNQERQGRQGGYQRASQGGYQNRGGQSGYQRNGYQNRQGGYQGLYGGFDKDKDSDVPQQRRSAPSRAKANSGRNDFLAIAPKPNSHDNKKKRSEEAPERKRRSTLKNKNVYIDEEYRMGSRKRKPNKAQKPVQPIQPIVVTDITITGDSISIKNFAEKTGKPVAEIIKKLMLLGMMCTINSEIDYDTASLIAGEFGISVEKKEEQTAESALIAEDTPDDEENLITRPPVVTIMGHVDHGKTSLLDAIRKTKVQQGEAGGITQHIGAYTISINGKSITFLDTPGHAAFTAMRARGAQVTDIAVLVVAADDGVMPQTIEAINHAKSAQVPVIVAINKIDKAGANVERIKQELTEYGLVSEEWGGDTIMVPVSALTGEGLSQLLEMILLVADVAELKANPNRMAKGTIVEARLDRGRGPVATVLVQNGTLHVQDTIVAGTAYGRVRAMLDDSGNSVTEAGPSMPVEVIGFSEVPEAGDTINAVEQDRLSKQVAEERKDRIKAEKLKSMAKVSLDDLFSKIAEGEIKDLNLVVKADVQGSVEALRQSLEKLSNDEVRVRVIHGGVGAISETDVLLASASNAIIIGFNVRPDANVSAAAERENVDIRTYRVIYNAIEDVEKAMKGLLEPEFKEEIIGHVEVRQTFKVSSVGTIAGSYVTDGKITRSAKIRLLRDGIVMFEGGLSSLKRFKDDVREVQAGYECGVTLENFNDIKEGDTLEAYEVVEVER